MIHCGRAENCIVTAGVYTLRCHLCLIYCVYRDTNCWLLVLLAIYNLPLKVYIILSQDLVALCVWATWVRVPVCQCCRATINRLQCLRINLPHESGKAHKYTLKSAGKPQAGIRDYQQRLQWLLTASIATSFGLEEIRSHFTAKRMDICTGESCGGLQCSVTHIDYFPPNTWPNKNTCTYNDSHVLCALNQLDGIWRNK